MKNFVVPDIFGSVDQILDGSNGYLRTQKRVFDVFICVLLMPAALPVIAILYLLVRMDGGAGLFGHHRIGRNGKVFRCWKLRSMVPDAEQRLVAHLAKNPKAAEEWHRKFKLENDPRVTPIGRFLRRSSLDELPQIWNVLIGEMSLVGPRPVISAELDRYGSARSAYCAVRPGITGLWQVSGRNDVTYDERVELDMRYLRTASAWKDLAIIALTARAVLMRTGR